MEHRFTGPDFTVGVEEELMIVDAETLDLVNAIESLLADATEGFIKPELMESVLEIATDPCRDMGECARQLGNLRRQVRDMAAEKGLRIGSAGPPAPSLWGGPRHHARPRAPPPGAPRALRAPPAERFRGAGRPGRGGPPEGDYQ